MTLGMVAKELAAACAKKLAKNSLQHPIIQKHVLKKIEKKLGITLLEAPATEQNLELLRQAIREEIGPYMDLEELMDSFQTTLENLARQQQEILDGLNDVKSLLEKISYPTSHHITIENPFLKEEIPTELLERIITGYLIGRREATDEFNRLVDSGDISIKIKRQLDEFKFLQQLREQERQKLKKFIKTLRELPGSYHDIRTYLEIRQLLEIGLNKEEKMILVGWILDQVGQSNARRDISALITFSQLLIRLGADEFIPHDAAQEIVHQFRNLLATSKRNEFSPTEQLEMLHFLHVFDRLNSKELHLLDKLVTNQLKETFGKKKGSQHPQRTKISNSIARMIRKLKIWKSKPERSIKILESELRHLKRRKFKRDTPLLRMQLERVTTETNLLASFLEVESNVNDDLPKTINLDELEYTVKELITILNNPNMMKLSNDTVLLALEALDACLYLMDIIALRNSQIILQNSREISQAFWIQELERYHKTSKRVLRSIIDEVKTEHPEIDEKELEEKFPRPPEKQKYKTSRNKQVS